MNKKLTRTLAGVMSLMFMGQVMIFGDGSAQGLLHADTIASAAEAIEGAKNKDQLAKEFEEATKDLGKVDYFDVAEDKNETANNEEIAEDDISVQSESDEAVQDHTAAITTASDGDAPAGELTVTGIVKQGVINGIDDKTPIYVRIFDENWNEIEYQELRSGDSYSVTASSGSGIYHVKYESDGYLPFYLKDFGTGTYTVGSGDSRNTVTLVPGDTTWNEEHDNEWSDDVINGKDLAYVQSCLGAYRGDDAFAKYLKLSDDEIELGKAQGSVLASIIGIKNDGKVTIDLSSVSDEDGSEYLGVSGAGKTYKLSKSDYETLCKIVAQECSVSYDGALAVVSHMCNMAEYGVPYYRKRGLMGTAKSSWYQAYTSGAYKKRHPANFVKRAVKDAINGKRNIPPYVLEFAAAGSVPKNWRNLEGERYYKRIGDNDYFYNIHDKEKLKKQTKAYEAALSGSGYNGAVVYYNQGDSPWAEHVFKSRYGSNKIRIAGCGPTSMAICISTITGKKVTPIQTCDWGAKQGLYIPGGWHHNCTYKIAKHWGLKCEGLDRNKSKLKKALKQGKMVVAIMGPGHFTLRGHFIVLYSISKDGKKVKVADCGGRARNRYWDIDTVFNESKTCNDAHCPFWAISK